MGTSIPSVAPGSWTVGRAPDGKPSVIVSFRVSDPEAVWEQLDRWRSALTATDESAVLVPVPLRLPDGEVRLVFPAPWRVGAEGLPAVPKPSQVLDVLRAVAATLDALHAKQVVHGGLGLASLWWESAERVVLPDVALAHALDGLVAAPSSAAAYHAPEVWRGGLHVPASDQYALAVIAYELFTGRSRTATQSVEGIMAFEPLAVDAHTQLYAGAPRGIAEVFQRALSSSPASRFGTCVEFVEGLAGHIDAVRSERTVHLGLRLGRRPITVRGVGFTLAAIAGIAAAFLISRSPQTPLRLAERMTARIPDPSRVETVMPGGGGSGPSISLPGASSLRRPPRGEAPSTAPTSTATTTRSEPVPAQTAPSSAPNAETERRTEVSTRTVTSSGSSINASVPSPRVVENEREAGASRAANAPAAVPSADVLPASNDAPTTAGTTAPAAAPTAAPVATPSGPGTIRLDVPAGSRVYLDGVLFAATPRTITTSAGTHDVDVLLPGAQQVTRRRVIVRAADTITVRLRR